MLESQEGLKLSIASRATTHAATSLESQEGLKQDCEYRFALGEHVLESQEGLKLDGFSIKLLPEVIKQLESQEGLKPILHNQRPPKHHPPA